MSDKLVHVNAYEREDGTPVREHWRGNGRLASIVRGDTTTEQTDSSLGNCMKPELEGGVQYDVILPGTDILERAGEIIPVIQVIMAVADVGVDLAIEAMTIASKIKKAIENFDTLGQEELIPQLKKSIDNMTDIQSVSEKVSQNTLNRLTSTKDQKEYSDLLKAYTKQKEFNDRNKAALNRIQTYLNDNNLDGVYKELQNYKNFNNTSNIDAQNELNAETKNWKQAITDKAKQYYGEINHKGFEMLKDIIYDMPNFEKLAVNIGMEQKNRNNTAYDAEKWWQMSANGLEAESDYINQNGLVIENISDLPPDFESIVRTKVRQQLGTDSARGVIFKPDSSISKDIMNSPELQKFVKDNIQAIINGEKIQGSTNFGSNTNLAYALGKADFINTYLNENGDIVTFVLDTYDFNENDARPTVQIAYNIQKHGKLENYYTISIISIPKETWLTWVFNFI